MRLTHTTAPTGTRQHLVTRDLGVLRAPASPGLGWHLRNWLAYRRRDLPKLAAAKLFTGVIPGLAHAEARLQGAVLRRPEGLAPERLARLLALLRDNVSVHELAAAFGGQVTEYGTLSTRVVTTAGVGYIVDAFQNLVELENMKYHGFGTGTTAEASGDTALVTEETTQYASDNTRPTGTTTEGASANIYRTVGTYSPDSGGTRAITEHGIFSQAATGGGVLLDRSVFSAVNLVAGSDSLQTTYELTFTAGS
jgi:hypothetical protein